MKLQLSIAGSGLPDAEASYYGVILGADGAALGQTSAATPIPDDEFTTIAFSDMVTVDTGDDADETTVSVQLCAAADNAVVAQLDNVALQAIMKTYTHATAASSEQGPNVALHVAEEAHGAVRFVLQGKDLPNTDFALFNKHQKTDPIYEIFNHIGKKAGKSNKVEDDLNPVWMPQTLNLYALCGRRLNTPLRIVVYDKDQGTRHEYLGSATLSIQQMLDQEVVPLVKGGVPVGKATLQAAEAELVPDSEVPGPVQATLTAALRVVDNLEALQEQAAAQREAATAAQEAAAAAQQDADDKRAAAEQLAAAQQEVESQLWATSQEAVDLDEAKKSGKLFGGNLVLGLAAQKLADTDFGFHNKSDPIFEVWLLGGDQQQLVRSNKVENNLNPVWEEQTVALKQIGTMDASLKIEVFDRDGGKDTQSTLGYCETSLNDLVAAVGNDNGIALQEQPKKAKGILLVKKAELADQPDFDEQMEKLQAKVQELETQVEAAKDAFGAAEDEADAALQAAAEAATAAQTAAEQADAAEAAVKMAEGSG